MRHIGDRQIIGYVLRTADGGRVYDAECCPLRLSETEAARLPNGWREILKGRHKDERVCCVCDHGIDPGCGRVCVCGRYDTTPDGRHVPRGTKDTPAVVTPKPRERIIERVRLVDDPPKSKPRERVRLADDT